MVGKQEAGVQCVCTRSLTTHTGSVGMVRTSFAWFLLPLYVTPLGFKSCPKKKCTNEKKFQQ